ncbi:MAG: hypothetical protein RLZ56_979 [Bacteroidota bacterium]|jgi:hypothetical protein
MKKNLLIAVYFAIGITAHAQSLIGGKQILKTNLSADALKNYNLTYERSLNHFMSVSISYSSMSKRDIPLQFLAKSIINNDNIDFDNFKIANDAITVESRFYLGLQKMSGFYIAPYARFANLDLGIPIHYSYNTISGNQIATTNTTALLNGTISSKSLGAYMGMQFQLLTKLVLDFWIVGGHYGSSSGKLQYNAPVGTSQAALTELKNTIDQTKVSPFHLNSSIVQNNDGTSTVITNTDGPWAGIRAAGITVGLRF